MEFLGLVNLSVFVLRFEADGCEFLDLRPANSPKMSRVHRPLGDGHEGKSVHGKVDHRGFAGSRTPGVSVRRLQAGAAAGARSLSGLTSTTAQLIPG